MYDYQLIRSKRTTLALEIKAGRVVVRAPMQASRATLDAFVEAHAAWIERHLLMAAERAAAHSEPDEARRTELARRAHAVLPERVEYYGRLMGLRPSKLTITGARTRFGSCSSRGSICFSWRLMTYPDAAIDYVVVHELAHLRHMNHGKGFYAEIARVMPDYRERAAMLKK